MLITVRTMDGKVVRRLSTSTGSGLHRSSWDLRWPGASGPASPVDVTKQSPWDEVGSGPLALAGTYTVELHQRVAGEETLLAGPMEFEVRDLNLNPMASDQAAKLAFELEVQDLMRRVQGATREHRLAMDRLARLRAAAAAVAAPEMQNRIGILENDLRDLWITLGGDQTVSRHNEPVADSIRDRLGRVSWGLRGTTMGPTDTQRRNVQMAATDFEVVGPKLARIIDNYIPSLVQELEEMGAPFSGGGEHLVPADDMKMNKKLWRKF